ncbi:MAG TPA: DEAD/DEAH box helicase [Desulfomicrobiaceae bacterium]|nr:DEAD/DEAH box helicase [Desulfomicrobiaceae bacterium]
MTEKETQAHVAAPAWSRDKGDNFVEPGNAIPSLTPETVPDSIARAMARCGWEELSQVQAMAIPYVLARRDVMIQSRTGSGKTGAFLLPLLERLDLSRPGCQALVLVPTRELAQQVTRDAETLAGDSDLKSVAVYGGVGYGPQVEAFRAGVQLVIGTPGRILDHLLKGTLNLDRLRVLVFDEADRMLSMGFYPDMCQLRQYLPKKRNGYMFSATFPPYVMRLAGEFLHEPEMLSLSRDKVHVSDITHYMYKVPAMKKDRCLVRLLEMENPQSAIIFCNTKSNVHFVTVVLKRFGFDADELSSDISQKAREQVLDRVRKGELRFLVSTDVAARGIDISDLSHVFQYEPPQDEEAYVHRSGRTGRAGATGTAISLVSGMEEIDLTKIAARFSIPLVERELPDEGEIAAVVGQRVQVLLEAGLRSRDKLKTERLERFVPLAGDLASSEEGLRLLAMLLDDYYQERFHAVPLAAPVSPAQGESGGAGSRERKSAPRKSRPSAPRGQGGGRPEAGREGPPKRRRPRKRSGSSGEGGGSSSRGQGE